MSVRANLHAALLHLRDGFIERIIWIDAICINQEDNDEKGRQVQSMAEIYAKATRVIVWLGEVADKSDYALEAIRAAAEEEYAVEQQYTSTAADRTSLEAIVTLLERPWFQRIWVLQEAAAARHILVKCGHTEIDGYAFCSGLRAQSQSDPYTVFRSPSIAYLMRGAIFRPRYRGSREDWPDRFSLNIRPLGELVDIYHSRKATDRRDKVYALIGMSSDDPGAAGLSADYNTSWKELFQKLINYCLSPQLSVSTWDDMEVAVIGGKGCILGQVSANRTQHDEQHVGIAWKNPPEYVGIDWKEGQSSQFIFQASAKPDEVGDVVCLLQGATNATIIRSCNDMWTIIAITVPLTISLRKWLASITAFPYDLLLIWDWDVSQGKEDYECFMSSRMPGYVGTDCQGQESMDGATRLWNHGLLLDTLGRYEDARRSLGKAVRIYGTGTALGSESKPDLSHSPYTEEDERTIRMMDHLYIDDKADSIESEYGQDSLTPLAWAVVEGDEALVSYLLDMDADVESKGDSNNPPLLWAATTGHQAIVKLLLDKGADIDSKGYRDRGALAEAASEGHKAVVKFLLDKGAYIESRDQDDHVPLTLAAKNGQKAVVRYLLDKGANIESMRADMETPLMWAVKESCNIESSGAAKTLWSASANRVKATIELLLDRGANIETKDRRGWGPLWVAAVKGNEAVVKLLLDRGANIETKDRRGWGPLWAAAVKGNEAIVKLLLDRGANIELKDKDGRALLWGASESGHEATVKLLLDRGAVYRLKDRPLFGFGYR
ncbi:hypothetical protein FGLOB1_2462 [Fusarium globosum]|uniref:Heterokaryon incompatibility domain-containing protein n=1 Tax=Fusarium globosum TaxID=78864 RepID=A0A8H5YS45_9HYPO|nr:hypothetical protein FGLOB1_2462 [Fusarium globosum]